MNKLELFRNQVYRHCEFAKPTWQSRILWIALSAKRFAMIRARLILFLSVTQNIYAGACCTSAASFGVGRLLMWEKVAFGLKSSAVNEIKYPSSIWQTEAWGIFGMGDRWSGYATMPWVVPIHYGNELSATHGLGDIQSGVRYQTIHIGEYSNVPSLALIGTITFPTGRPYQNAIPSTGRGIWALGLGTSIEQTWAPWFLQLNLGATLPLSKQALSYGPGAQVILVGGREFPHEIVLSGILEWTYDGPMKKTNDLQARPFGYRTGAGVSLAYRFHPHFTWQTSAMSDLPWKGFSENLPTNFTISTGLRCGIF